MVREHACKISDKNGLRRATKSLASLISYIQHTNDFPRLKFCWRSWWLEINLRRSLVYLSKQNNSSWSWMCKKRYPTALQNLKSFLWMDCEWMDYLLSLEHCDRGITFQPPTLSRPWWLPGNWCDTQFPSQDPKCQKAKGWSVWCGLCTHWHTFCSRRVSVAHLFKDNEAVIKMIRDRSPTMRQVSRKKHMLALDWFFDRIKLEPKIPNQKMLVDTKNQLADTLTRGRISRDGWNHLRLFNIEFLDVLL